jgi:hypothetical protein
MARSLRRLFQYSSKYKDVRNVNIYALRALFVLMFFVLGKQVWSYILGHSGPWDSNDAVAYSVFAGFSFLALLGIINPIKMLPLLFLEIFYKILWLILVAYPLWSNDQVASTSVEERTFAFSLVVLPIIAMPWRYAYKTYITNLPKA